MNVFCLGFRTLNDCLVARQHICLSVVSLGAGQPKQKLPFFPGFPSPLGWFMHDLWIAS